MELILVRSALALYLSATLCAFVYLSSKEEKWSSWMLRLLGLGLLLHMGGFGLRLQAFWVYPENRYLLPVNSMFGALSYLAMAFAAVFFVVERRHRLGLLGAFVLPWTVIGTAAALLFGGAGVEPLSLHLQSYWLNIHPVVIMTAYAIFGNAFGVGLALLIQENQIKSRSPGELSYRLPSIEDLDRLNTRLIAAALPFLLAGILMGIIWAHKAWGGGWTGDAKVIWACVTAAIYAGYLFLRFSRGLRGRKAVYVSMFGFASVIFSLVVVNLISDLHGYLS